MSALSKIHDYLKEHFAGHDTTALIQQFETAIESKVEEGLADLKQEIADLKASLNGATNAKTPEPITLMPAGAAVNLAPGGISTLPAGDTASALIPPAKQAEIAALPPIAQPDAKVEATTEITK